MSLAIPWSRVAEFHREIEIRSEEKFFSFDLSDNDSDRFSFLDYSVVTRTEVDAEIYSNQFMNTGFLTKKTNANDEYYVGGMLWFSKSKLNSKWITTCHPLLYKAFSLQVNDNETVRLEPTQATWDISPLFYKLLDKKGIVVNNIDEIIIDLLESADHKSDETNFDDIFITLLIERFPELEKDFIKYKPKYLRCNWLVFVAPKDYSYIHQSLILDYNRLIEKLNTNPEELGGLALLDGNNCNETLNCPINEIVLLNNSQRESVEKSLSGDGVSIISGPPGCGKSQVVLSILLNAWQNEKSVIFASSNNKAVDVVRSRIRPYEKLCPIVVRAGSRRYSEVKSAIDSMLSAISRFDKRKKESDFSKEIEQSNQVINSIQQLLDTGIPQRINDLLQTGLTAYLNSCENEEKYRLLCEPYNTLLAGKNITFDIEAFSRSFFPAYKEWVNEHSNTRQILDEYELQVEDLRLKHWEGISKRKELTEKLYNKGIRDYQIFEITADAMDWLHAFQTLISEFTEEVNKPSFENFGKWVSIDEVNSWRTNANDLLGIINEYNTFLNENSSEIETLRTNEEQYRYCVDELSLYGLKPLSTNLYYALLKWVYMYNEYYNTEKHPHSFVRLIKRIYFDSLVKMLEKKLLAGFSDDVASEIATNPRKLHDTISAYHEKWIDEFALRAAVNTENSLKSDLDEKNKRIADLFCKLIPHSVDNPVSANEVDISFITAKIEEKKEEASRAEKQFLHEQKIDSLCNSYNSLRHEGTRILSVLIDGIKDTNPLLLLNNALSECVSNSISTSALAEIKDLAYQPAVESYLQDMMSIRDISIKTEEYDKSIAEIETNMRNTQESWVSKAPKDVVALIHDLSFDDAEEFLTNNDLQLIFEKWEKSAAKEAAELKKKSEEEKEYAIESFSKAIDICPEDQIKHRKKDLKKAIEDISDESIIQIKSALDEINIDKLKQKQIREYTLRENLLLSQSAHSHLEKISKDNPTKSALSLLSYDYSDNNDVIGEAGEKSFKDVLKALPIWITTGQSPQSLPLIPGEFELLVIDEATQCSITSILPLIYRCKRIAVIGDTEQLTSINSISQNAESYLANKYNVESYMPLLGHCNNNIYKAMLQTVRNYGGNITFLSEHYRSNPLIIGFANQYIYKNRLILQKNMPSVELTNVYGVFGKNVVGQAVRDSKESWYNQEEAHKVVDLIQDLRNVQEYSHFTIGVISPFRGQIDLINKILNERGLLDISVNTVHQYQGDERDIIIFSPVVSRGIAPGTANWVESPHNLINVAVTRAKEALFVVADFDVCRRQKGILGELIRYVDTIELLRKTSFYELQLYGLMLLQGWNVQVHPIIRNIEVDFMVEDRGSRVVVEVDGSQHIDQQITDKGRDSLLATLGLAVVRIPTRSIENTPYEAINSIAEQLESIF